MKRRVAIVGLALALCSGLVVGADVVRHKIPNSDFPIAQAVEIPVLVSIPF